MQSQKAATIWLSSNLKLKVHSNNNVIVKVSHGLRFLGHYIYPSSNLSVDRTMTNKIKRDLHVQNVGSYKAMHLPNRLRRRFPWLLYDSIYNSDYDTFINDSSKGVRSS